MMRSQILNIGGYEIEKVFDVKTNYDHKIRGGYGEESTVSASVRNYWSGNDSRNTISRDEMAGRIIALLKDRGHIGEGKYKVLYHASHSWSAYDDDGYASSIYSHHVEIVISNEHISL